MDPKKRIMIVEDESIVAMDIREVLNDFGFEVCAVTASGEESVSLANEQRPDLVLMDVKLKGKLNGLKAARLIRENLDIPVVYLTAYGDEDTLKEAFVISPFGHINKPFVENELQNVIERIFSQIKTYGRAC